MKDFKRRALNSLAFSAFAGLMFSLTQLASTVKAQTTGVQSCNAQEAAAFTQMTGSFHSYRMNITIGGSCEKATGGFEYVEWCEGVDKPSNSSLKTVEGSFTGRMSGGSLQVAWDAPASPSSGAIKGTGSCSANGDGTFSCRGFPCENTFKLSNSSSSANKSTAPQPPVSPRTSEPRVSSPIATVGGMRGDVSVSSNGGTFVDMTPGRQLQAGDEISTGPDSEMVLTFPDGSTVHIEPNTQITIASLAAQRNDIRVRMNLRFGKVAAQVNKSRAEVSDYSVKTATATVSVRGTAFTVQHDQRTQSTTVSVQEGTVRVTPENGSLRAVAVSAGQQVQVAQNRVGPVTGSTGRTGGGIGASVSVSGRWSGNYTNSKEESGKSTITINQLADGTITGDEDGWRIENGRRNGDSLTWQYLRQNNGCRDYQVSLQLSNDGQTLTGNYQVTDRCATPSTYEGRYVSYKRQ